ncbi:MAG: FAD-dependent oxidoreductase, partial [Acidobacteriota bacterium]
MDNHDLIIIGGGEAGLSAALRGAQLGARILMINKDPELGGGCVQTGTLPSKTLRTAATFLENLKKGKRYGIAVDESFRANYKAILESQHKATRCEVGVLATLVRRNKIDILTGEARFDGPASLEVRLPDGSRRKLTAPKILIASGSRPIALPGLDFNGRTVLSPDDLRA